ncbi:MAG: hypothetical protein U0T82_00990 [Bacteroidales bacterium]
MKKSIIALLLITVTVASGYSQAPTKFNYQAVIRDASGAIKANETVNIQVGILQGNITSTPLYLETQSKTTNEFGVVNLVIGEVVPIPSGIDWANGPFYLKIWVNEVEMGTSQLLTVPYAIYANYAKEAGNGFSGDYNDLSNKPVTDGSETKILSGNNIEISGSGTAGNPYIIYANSSNVGKHYIGELFAGGVVFYIDHTGAHGLVCSLVDVSTDTLWSNVKAIIGDSAKNLWDGEKNCKFIVAQKNHTKSAAQVCLDYINDDYGTGFFSDWYLPSYLEWDKLYHTRFEIEKALLCDGDERTKPLDFVEYYWTSTEYQLGYVWAILMYTGDYAYFSKSESVRVRTIRKF